MNSAQHEAPSVLISSLSVGIRTLETPQKSLRSHEITGAHLELARIFFARGVRVSLTDLLAKKMSQRISEMMAGRPHAKQSLAVIIQCFI